jgi:hypothetical protein
MEDGQVAAARSAIIPALDHVETMRVSIPADQLELRKEHLPASAEVSVYRGADILLASERFGLPLVAGMAKQ